MHRNGMQRLAVIAVAIFASAAARAGDFAAPIQDVPALDTWGLIGISAVLGIAGVVTLLRRRK